MWPHQSGQFYSGCSLSAVTSEKDLWWAFLHKCIDFCVDYWTRPLNGLRQATCTCSTLILLNLFNVIYLSPSPNKSYKMHILATTGLAASELATTQGSYTDRIEFLPVRTTPHANVTQDLGLEPCMLKTQFTLLLVACAPYFSLNRPVGEYVCELWLFTVR